MTYTNKKIRKGRGIAITVEELMESKRLEIAVEYFKEDPLLLRAILTELCIEVFNATKSSLTKIVGKHYGMGFENENGETVGKGLTAEALLPYMRGLDVDILNNMNVHWNMTQAEQNLYRALVKGNLTEKEKEVLVEKAQKALKIKKV